MLSVLFFISEVQHPKGVEFERANPYRLDIDSATTKNDVDFGVFTIRYMKTWMGVTKKKFHSFFPLTRTEKKSKLTLLRKKICNSDCDIECE
ncbi:hypothetical protein Hanom_Chr13g01189421 [Helianthus anomalus]